MSPRKISPLLRWPIRRSDLMAALGTDFERIHLAWCDWDKTGTEAPLQVSWVPSPDNVGAGARQAQVSIWVHPVPQGEAAAIRTALIATAMSDLSAWTANALNATETWKGSRHERVWRFHGGSLTATDDDGMHILDRERGTH